ncbi:PIG-L family deacetylase [Oceanobacillus arenosus]|nr:PIG-L family deacetylase [Oceanobacillus arenosus]
MKKILLLLLLLFFPVLFTGTVYSNGDGNQVIYYIPHQDDEVLTFGVSIYSYLQQGYDVHVVLLTDGSNSGIRKQLGMTKEAFVTARNQEFDKALAVLGVKSENITKRAYTDGQLTEEQVEAVIKEYNKKYPMAIHKTFSYYDPHPDHAAAGNALRNLVQQEILTDAAYYIGPNYTPTNVDILKDSYDSSYYPFIKAASQSYNVENEIIGMYGIGWKSVPKQFEFLESDPMSRYHE